MTILADERGFLLGDPVDLGRMPKYLLDIKGDVAAIKKAVVGTSEQAKKRLGTAPTVTPIRPGRESSSQRTVTTTGTRTATPRSRSSSSEAATGTKKAGVVDRLKSASSRTVAVMPNRDASGRFAGDKSASTAKNRDASGRFTGNGDSESRESSSAVAALASRLAALAGIGSGMEEVDPTVKAFREVAEPMQRGIEFFSGGDKKERWFRKIFKSLESFRKDESVFSKAAKKSLKNIEGKPVGAGDDDDNGGLLLGLAARLGPALLAGITAVLGFIFSPIGAAIGAASALAWGLFTENGQKFFGEVGAKLIAGWDGVVSAFAPVTDAIGKKFDDLINGMASTWDTFTGFLKDKFGIDVPALFKPVVDLGKKVVDAGADVVKNTTSKAVDAVQKSSPKTAEALGNAWNKVKNGAGKIKFYATEKGNAETAMKVLMDKGWTKEQAAGIAANLAAESGFDTGATGDNGKAKGIAQWHPDRQKKFEQVYGKKLSDATLEEQVGFVDWELRNTEKKAGDKIRTAATAEQAAALTERHYERSALGLKGGVQSERLSKANEYAAYDVNAEQAPKSEPAPAMASMPEDKVRAPAAASISEDPTQGVRYKFETLEGSKVQVTDNETGVIELASDEQANAYRRQQGKPYRDKIAVINAGDMQLYNRLAAGTSPVASQTVSANVPSPPSMPTAPKIAEAPPIVEPLSTPDNRPLMVSITNQDVGQNVSDRRIAHIVTGGLSG
jgi:hypothetical protein